VRLSFLYPQRPPRRPIEQRPLTPSRLPDDRASRRHPFIPLQRHLLRALQRHVELHPAQATQLPPFLHPQQLSRQRLFHALQERPLRPPKRPALRRLLQRNQRHPLRLLPGVRARAQVAL
jgi:hypothetical protein